MADLEKLTDRAAEILRGRKASGGNINACAAARTAINGSGVTNPADVKRLSKQIVSKMSERSAAKRSADVQHRERVTANQDIRDRVAP